MSRRRDLGSMFDEVGPGESHEPAEPANRVATVDEPLINDEARQMLEERSRAVGEAAARAAEVAYQKGKELGKAALGARARMKVERQRRAEEKAAAGKEKQGAYDQTMAMPMSASFEFADSNEEQHGALLEGLAPEEVRAVLADPGVREASAPLVYDGMGQLPSEVDVLFANLPVFPVGQGSIGMTTVQELVPTPKRSYNRAALIGCGVLILAVLGGAAYWWSARPAPAPVIAPKSEGAPVAKPAPEVAPAVVPTEPAPVPVVEPVAAPAPIEEPEATVPLIDPAPGPVVAPAATPDPEISPPAPRPTSIKPRPKKIEIAPATQAPKAEEQQIEQIRDFGKQLESVGGG